MQQRFKRSHMFVHTFVRYVCEIVYAEPAIESPYGFDAAATVATVNSAQSHYKRNEIATNRMHAPNTDNNKLCAISLALPCWAMFSLAIIHSKMSICTILCVNRMCGILHAELLYFDATTKCVNECMHVHVHVCLFSTFFTIFWFTFMCLNLNFKSLNCWHYRIQHFFSLHIRMTGEKADNDAGATTPGIWNVTVRFM